MQVTSFAALPHYNQLSLNCILYAFQVYDPWPYITLKSDVSISNSGKSITPSSVARENHPCYIFCNNRHVGREFITMKISNEKPLLMTV